MINRNKITLLMAGNIAFVVVNAGLVLLFKLDGHLVNLTDALTFELRFIILATLITTHILFLVGGIAWMKISSQDETNEVLKKLGCIKDLDFSQRIKINESYDKNQTAIFNQFNQVVDVFNYNWQKNNAQIDALKSELNLIKSNLEDKIETEKMASLGRLVAGVSHEINTPLGIAVTGMTHLQTQRNSTSKLLDSGKISAKDLKAFLIDAEKSIDLVLNQVYLAANLIKNFKQVAVDQSAPETREIVLNDYIEKVVSTVQPLFKKSPYKLVVPEVDEISVTTCPGALSQVITILVQNALNHAFDSRNVGFVYINIEITETKISIVVKDDGVGIPVSHRKKIFEPFYTTKRGEGGSGLGLSLAYNICKELLMGKLYFRSNEQGGSDFVIEIPKNREGDSLF